MPVDVHTSLPYYPPRNYYPDPDHTIRMHMWQVVVISQKWSIEVLGFIGCI